MPQGRQVRFVAAVLSSRLGDGEATMNLPDDFETHNSGTFRILSNNLSRIAELEAELESVKRELDKALEQIDIIAAVQTACLRPDPDHVAA